MMDDLEDTKPVPIINNALCNGCALCVAACPSHVLAMRNGRAVVAHAGACDYEGLCEMICPVFAIGRPFLIVAPPTEEP